MKMTKENLLALDPCAEGLQFAKAFRFNFPMIWNVCERGDWLIWLLRKINQLDKPTAVTIAIACAERVLPAFEKKFPSDSRPRKAIEAAQAWLKNPSQKTDDDAYAAYAAANERKWQADTIRKIVKCPFDAI